jgi:hemoglobin-like flavoprotein
MTATQIELVEKSFQKVAPIAADAARLFYGRLFELDPSLRPMFRGDIEEQGRKLMQMRRQHASYGVRDEHYATVAEALLWTLGQGLGEDFTPETREAWTAVYQLLAGAMQQGSQAAAA